MYFKLIEKLASKAINSNPALVFIHGAWHGAWCWEENFLTYFSSNGFDCYAFDLPKHGAEKKHEGINKLRIKDYVNRLEEVVAEINKPCVLIGHSMGGYTVQQYLEEKECVGAILMAPVPGNHILPLFLKFSARYPKTILQMFWNWDGMIPMQDEERVQALLFSKDLPKDKLEFYTKSLGPESMQVVLIDFLFRKIQKRKNLTIPMLVQSAGLDEMVSNKENLKTADFQTADFQFFTNLAHDMMLEPNWQQSADGILEWLHEKFPPLTQKENNLDLSNKVKNTFSNAIPNLITKFGSGNDVELDNTKNLGRNDSKS